MAHTVRIEFSLPDGIDLVSIHSKWHGGYNVCLKVGYDVRDPFGSSLGAIYGSAEATTVAECVQAALERVQTQVLAANDRVPKPVTGISKPTKTAGSSPKDSQFANMDADQIFAFLAAKASSR